MNKKDFSYCPVTDAVVDELVAIVGKQYVIYHDPERLEPFSHDEIPGKHYRAMPEVVVRPLRVEEVAAIVRLANEKSIPVTPRGAGSGLSGGAVPVHGGIVICSDRMNHIIDFDPANMTITVEPGVITNDINEYVRDSGLFYAGYPMSVETCFIGGNVAENAGGGKAVKYGVTVRYVLGLEVVTPTGTIVQLGGTLMKDVTGYNLIPLMTGSEGTLGFFTKITLKLIPRPKYQTDLLCLFSSSRQAIDAVPKLLISSGVTPTSIEYMDRQALAETCAFLNETLPWQSCGAMLLVTIDGFEKSQVEKDYEAVGLDCVKLGATEVYVADNPATSERLWKLRRTIPEAFSMRYPIQSGEDVVVPPASIPVVVSEFEQLADKYGVRIPCYGHAGDGNLHARICAPGDWSSEKWYETLPTILREAYAVVAQVGGRISGEHGIGHKRIDYMTCVVSEEYLDMLRAIKLGLDPKNIMNPGKVFYL